MKMLQWFATMAFVVAGILLLVGPSDAAVVTAAGGFVPTRFTVVDEGTVGKPDVVMIPGMSSSRAVWEAEAKLLAPNYRLHLVQVDGFAGAAAGANAAGPMLPGIVEELHGYIEAAKMKPVVVGHSLGGLLALMLADKHPEDVRKMVIVEALPYYGVVFNPAATVEMVKPQAEAMGGQIAGMPADQFAMMAPMMAAQMVKDPEGQKVVAAASLATDRGVMVKSMLEDLETDLRGDVASIKTPTLVLFAVDAATPVPDPVVYEGLVRDGYKPMPNVTLVKVEGSRHFIMYDQPGKMDVAMENFLK
jgi:pimeloyl-ACP methyl ester carboxylesterase